MLFFVLMVLCILWSAMYNWVTWITYIFLSSYNPNCVEYIYLVLVHVHFEMWGPSVFNSVRVHLRCGDWVYSFLIMGHFLEFSSFDICRFYFYWPIERDYKIWFEYYCSPMVQEIRVQSQVESYQRLKKWYLMQPCLILSFIK